MQPLARALHAAVGFFRVPQRIGRAAVTDFARRVDAEAAGLADLSEAGFDRILEVLRADLRRSGLQDTLVPRGFALV